MTTTRFARLLGCVFLLSGCISAVSHPPAGAPIRIDRGVDSFYAARGSYLFGGLNGVVDAFQETVPSAQRRDDYDPPPRGTFVRIRPRDHEMSLGGKIYGYVTVFALLSIIPFYNGETGCDVIYEIFHDGAPGRTYTYAIHRHLFIWLPVLPLSWISAITPSEGDATYATTLRFFADATADHAL